MTTKAPVKKVIKVPIEVPQPVKTPQPVVGK